MGAVDLCLVAFGETGTYMGAEILSAIAVIVDLCFHAVAEILIVAALAKEMAFRPATDQNPVFHFPLGLVGLMRFPAGQVLAVKELHPFAFVFVIARRYQRQCERTNQKDTQRARCIPHIVPFAETTALR